ncbi:putative colanic acid biosynthesis acetyltransferase [Methylomonas sp. DH-1]|uniref:putative colanic acid biosynthesis acetyltransferase n=1 Tax=Methylomonas sp. (strain DH-1) TaxID=1727196 RepID=UPI0009ED98EC|nr:putative colanic acid biosynthesis acetyltransferase [Methylomonas sp. DH-1]
MASQFSKYKYVDTLSRRSKLQRLIWTIVWWLFFRTTPRWCMNSWRIFLLKVFGAKLGVGNKVAPSCFVWAPWNLEMGDYSVLAEGVDCYSMDRIHIGSKVAVSQRSFLCTGTHDISSLRRPLITKPIHIGNHAWICAEAFIAPGVSVGEGGIVGARAVVTKNVEAWSVVAGNPAVFVKDRKVVDN